VFSITLHFDKEVFKNVLCTKRTQDFSIWVTKTFLKCNFYGNGVWWYAIFLRLNSEGEQFFCKQGRLAKKLLYYRVLIIQLLGKCLRGNKIAPLRHEGRAERGPSAEGVQFYCPSSTYPAIVLLVLYSIAIFLQCDPVCKKIASLLSLDAKKLHTISLHFHKNCILKRF
jgi:hypothetical protein